MHPTANKNLSEKVGDDKMEVFSKGILHVLKLELKNYSFFILLLCSLIYFGAISSQYEIS